MQLSSQWFVLLFLAVCAGPVFAQNADGTDAFKKFDKDGDGKVTKGELPNEKAFERFDKDQDGVITRAEFAGAGKPGANQPGGRFDILVKTVDKNGDGKITKAEAGAAPWFSQLDQNRDGVVDAAELEKARKAMGANQGDGKEGGQVAAVLKKLDKDGDGKLTKAEVGDAPWFGKLDKNSDGVLDAEEVSKLAAARRKAAE
ncbi:MAG: EF-hand domain-containing protein [Planctomycetaceae bacterium]|nr:EF-hand domain-containing protein [Planctomycetaceae bacterium]